MQTAVGFSLSSSSLIATTAYSDRFSYEIRFSPLIFQDADGQPLLSPLQEAWSSIQNNTTIAATNTGFSSLKPLKLMKSKSPGSPGISHRGAWRSPDDIAASLNASELGALFLERTRVRPMGFAIGEHLHSISLAPGEEVTIQQKAFSERQTTLEKVSEQDVEQNNELSSTLTGELQNSLSHMMSENQTRGFNINGNVAGDIDGVKIGIDAGYSDSITDADQTTRQSSVRISQTSTAKVAAKLRSQHKITFRVSETSRFESSTQRTIRNPNTFSPIDLLYFKLMQRVSISHERYGIRLCWAPFVKNPGQYKAKVIQDAYDFIVKKAMERIVQIPKPDKPVAAGMPSIPNSVHSADTELNKWGILGDMSADYRIKVLIPTGGRWDGNVDSIKRSCNHTTTGPWGRPDPSVYVVDATYTADGVEVLVHAGAGVGWAGSHLYVSFDVGVAAVLTTALTPDQQKEFDDWSVRMLEWQSAMQSRQDAAREEADREFAAWKEDFEANFDPVQCLMQGFIAIGFPQSLIDAFGEVDFWSNAFDFEHAAVRLYPAWWSPGGGSADPTKSPTTIENASWAKLFLPIRVGYEEMALRLIYGKSLTNVPTKVETAIQSVTSELRKFRIDNFGSENEVSILPAALNDICPVVERPYICLGRWEEFLPTDGTHMEVIQAGTTAMDDASKQSADDAHSYAVVAQQLKTAQADITASASTRPDINVQLNIGNEQEK